MSMTVRSVPSVRVIAPRTAAPASTAKAAAPEGAGKVAGQVGGAIAGGVGGLGLSAVVALGVGLAKWGMRSAPGWFGVAAWTGIGLATLGGAIGGAKLLGGLGEKIENFFKR